MVSSPPGVPAVLSKHRLEALSDGVFSVVMTLLVLELKLEHLPAHPADAEIGHAVAHLAKPLFGYVVAFGLTGAFWLLQHRAFSLLAHSSIRHAWFTLAFLFPVTLTPFTVSVFVQALGTGAAFALYFGNLALIASLLFAGWLDARRGGLLVPGADPAVVRLLTVRMAAMALGFVVAGVVGFFQPALAGIALLVVLLVSRRFARPAATAPA